MDGSSWWFYLCLLEFIFLLLPNPSLQGVHERRLLEELFEKRKYNKLERPAFNDSEAIKVTFGLTLQQIIDVNEKTQVIATNIWFNMDEKMQIINTNIWLDLGWPAHNLKWNPAKFGNITVLRVPALSLWRPDILMYNSADEKFDGTYPVNILVNNDGNCSYVPPGMFKSTCKIDITWFPFDDQFCEMKFGSWTYDGSKIDLQLSSEEADISSFIRNGEWNLIGFPGLRNVQYYACCKEPYLDLTFTLHIRRRKLYFVVNLIMPCAILSALTMVVFLIPPDAGEKVSFGVPAKRNVKKYACCVEEYLDVTYVIHIRRRTLYYGFNLIIPCVLISSMALLTFTLPPDAGEKISLGVTILLSLTVFLLLVAETMPPTSDAVPLIGMYFACIMLMCSLSVVFTVLVLNFHHRNGDTHEMPEWVKKGLCEWVAWCLRMKRPGKELSRSKIKQNAKMRELEMNERSSKSLLANVLDLDDDFRRDHNSYSIKLDDGVAPPSGNSRTELGAIIKEIRFITDKMRKKDDEEEVVGDWKFAAMVIDRICLIGMYFACIMLMSSLSVVATVLVLNFHHRNGDTHDMPDWVKKGLCEWVAWAIRMKRPGKELTRAKIKQNQKMRDLEMNERSSKSLLANVLDLDDDFRRDHNSYHNIKLEDGVANAGCLSKNELGVILKEIKFITDRMKTGDEDEEVIGDWKFAAMVIDRLCLICFSIFTSVSTCAILFSAPTIFSG